MLLKKLARLAGTQCLLRQHYLDQFFGSPAFRAELSAFVVPADGRLAPHLWTRLGRTNDSVKPPHLKQKAVPHHTERLCSACAG
jgi:hypothetical protein